MKTKKLSATYKYIILSICYVLIGICTNSAHAETSTAITGIESITREGQDHKKIIERNISANDETKTFAFTFTLDRDLGEPRSTKFILSDNQGETHEGIINEPREVCNAYNKKDKTEDDYSCHVEATFPAKTYTDFQIEIMDISGNKMSTFSGKMPELEINFDAAKNTLQLKNISDKDLAINSITDGKYIKVANKQSKIAPQETLELKLTLESPDQAKDKITIKSTTDNEPITTEIEFVLGQNCTCPTGSECKTCEENATLVPDKTNTEMAVSILPIESGKYKVMLFLKNDDSGQKLPGNYSVQLQDDNNEIHNLIIDKNTIEDQDCLRLIGTRGCIVTFEGAVENHKKSNKYMSYRVSVTYENQFGTKNTQSFSSNLEPEISCEVVKDINGYYTLVINNLTGEKINITGVYSPDFEIENKMTALALYKGTPLRLPLPWLKPGSSDIQIYYGTKDEDKPKILILPLGITEKDSGHWYDGLLRRTVYVGTTIVVVVGSFAIYAWTHPVHQVRGGNWHNANNQFASKTILNHILLLFTKAMGR